MWTANPDLTAEQQLTHGNANSGWPAWAPDASRIAFDSDRSDPDPTDHVFVNDVFTMRPDGSDVRKLTDSVGFSGDPAYSPDGSLIAFDANRGSQWRSGMAAALPDLSIFVINADGTGMRRVTTPPAGTSDTEPRFSPDGTKLVFTRFRGGTLRVRSSRRRHLRGVHRQPRRHRHCSGSPVGARRLGRPTGRPTAVASCSRWPAADSAREASSP